MACSWMVMTAGETSPRKGLVFGHRRGFVKGRGGRFAGVNVFLAHSGEGTKWPGLPLAEAKNVGRSKRLVPNGALRFHRFSSAATSFGEFGHVPHLTRRFQRIGSRSPYSKYKRKRRLPYPGGMKACSRGLRCDAQRAPTPPVPWRKTPTLEGSQPLPPLPGWDRFCATGSGGVARASLNHRLQAGNPPGSRFCRISIDACKQDMSAHRREPGT
jgi:hypothetical protein